MVTDASQTGIGAWIGQGPADKIRPAAYYSKKLNACELRYGTPEKEILAIYKGLQHFDSKLRGITFTILTDYQAWTHFMDSKPDSDKYRRWQEYMTQFDMKIKYTKGSENYLADKLSRQDIRQLVSLSEKPSTTSLPPSTLYTHIT